MKTETKQTPDALEGALKQSIQGTRHAIKFVARFVAALLKVRSSNLVKIANAVETEAEADSVYRQIQRFLDNDNRVVIDYLKLMKLDGKLKILIDRTEWKFGARWINILTLSVAYKNVAIPILWEVMEHKGNRGGTRTHRDHREVCRRIRSRADRESLRRPRIRERRIIQVSNR